MREMARKIAALNRWAPFDLMKFTLTYDGQLVAAGKKPRAREKWGIRRVLHPQLAELWQTHPTLRALATSAVVPQDPKTYWQAGERLERHHSAPAEQSVPFASSPRHRNLCGPIPVGPHGFIPVIRESMASICRLDILFLRRETPGKLISQGGDLDNRIKTLFDALRMPKEDEIKFADGPIDSPFHCLLEDDRLITGTSVETGYLLTSPDGKESEVRLVINVTVRVTHVHSYNLPLIGD